MQPQVETESERIGMNTNTIDKLNQLAEFIAQRDLINTHKQEMIEAAFPVEVRAALAEIEIEFQGKSAAVNANIQALEDEIKLDVLNCGETVKGNYLQAVWSKGKTTWDSKALEKLIDRYPTLSAAKKTGLPSVAIRAA